MPAFSLALYPISMITRLVRSSMKEVMKQDYIVLARSKGTPMIKVILGHALKNCLIPVVTYAGPLLAFLITGSFVIESLFSIPGIGSEFVNSVTNRDYTMIMALTILFGSFIIIVNILTDLLVAFIDPRVKLEKKAS
jgi:oligopeptide transport system permease protein